MELVDRIAKHRRMAESYRDKYVLQTVQEGDSYDEWEFTDDAVYTSPYFVADQELVLKDVATSFDTAATVEAKAYSVVFPDWKPVEFKCWPADNGFVMRNRWEGTSVDGETMGFYSISFVETNDEAQITHWSTYVNDEEYGPFLEKAIGARGPFHGDEYMQALARHFEKHSLTL
ncbi:hypothetical protein [Mycobacterium sp. ACS4331]|uniref:hypothetical protein n=1 Tax=Mycobacterium sp. ACS4331 TaxID=1834121 RepID=UPI00080226B3|nr:hypothetical protein [Mycobacterium sp. ACS4331]OBF14883.1 hypothetical protein A5727_15385 [Mycobacterium sp. ACS4331]